MSLFLLPLLSHKLPRLTPLRYPCYRPETMRATLDVIAKEYGSVDEYVKQHTSLTDEDLARMRANLLVP